MRSIFIILLFFSTLYSSESRVFDDLLKKAKESSLTQSKEDKLREKRFLEDLKNQQAALDLLKKQIQEEELLSNTLREGIDAREEELVLLDAKLKEANSELGELFGTVKQISTDLSVKVNTSLVSLEHPQRREFLKNLLNQRTLPNIEQLEEIWRIMLQEIIEAGNIRKFSTKVLSNDSFEYQDVIRIGNFNIISKNAFLQYDSFNSVLIEPISQPNFAILSVLNRYFNSTNEISELIVDPTKGSLIEMISYKPTVQERIRQGGVIGYIIIVIGIVGILFAFFKYIWLFVISIKVKRQLKNLDTKISNNPLGRIINIYNDNKNLDATDLEYRIDEALYKETPTLQGGFSMIKLFAAASPLLGLLGTVTGMILTFQSITMFGTSDPKLMAGGISQALVTTMLGLSVAIPLLFAHTVLNSKAKKIINILEQQSLSLIAKRLN